MIITKKKGKRKIKYADSLATPDPTFDLCQKIWNVKCTLDLTATELNTKCKKFITPQQDFFKVVSVDSNEVLWGNFPHSKQKEFVEHAFNIWINSNCQMLLLLPINTLCSNYAKKFILPWIDFDKKMILTGRIAFKNRRGKISKHNSVNGYVCVFYPRRNPDRK